MKFCPPWPLSPGGWAGTASDWGPQRPSLRPAPARAGSRPTRSRCRDSPSAVSRQSGAQGASGSPRALELPLQLPGLLGHRRSPPREPLRRSRSRPAGAPIPCRLPAALARTCSSPTSHAAPWPPGGSGAQTALPSRRCLRSQLLAFQSLDVPSSATSPPSGCFSLGWADPQDAWIAVPTTGTTDGTGFGEGPFRGDEVKQAVRVALTRQDACPCEGEMRTGTGTEPRPREDTGKTGVYPPAERPRGGPSPPTPGPPAFPPPAPGEDGSCCLSSRVCGVC